MAAPQRRENPSPLSAHIAPLERALIARADAVVSAEGQRYLASEVRKQARIHGVAAVNADGLAGVLAVMLATEFRALAAEMHHW